MFSAGKAVWVDGPFSGGRDVSWATNFYATGMRSQILTHDDDRKTFRTMTGTVNLLRLPFEFTPFAHLENHVTMDTTETGELYVLHRMG